MWPLHVHLHALLWVMAPALAKMHHQRCRGGSGWPVPAAAAAAVFPAVGTWQEHHPIAGCRDLWDAGRPCPSVTGSITDHLAAGPHCEEPLQCLQQAMVATLQGQRCCQSCGTASGAQNTSFHPIPASPGAMGQAAGLLCTRVPACASTHPPQCAPALGAVGADH